MRADRLLAIVLHLQAHPTTTTYELAQQLGVARRTILRDIDALSRAGVPVVTQSGTGGGVWLDEHYRLALHGFQEAELRALLLAGNARLMHEVGLGAPMERVRAKLMAALPPAQQQAVQRYNSFLFIDPAWWNDRPAPSVLPSLLAAVADQRRIVVDYLYPDGQVNQRELCPYGLVAKAGTWYLMAERDKQMRTYRVSRCRSVSVLEGRFERRIDFDLAYYWSTQAQAFYEAQLQYRYTLAVRRDALELLQRYHTGRYTIVEADGAAEWVRVAIEAEAIEPAMMLVFGLGSNCQVIEPPELKQAVVQRSRQMLDQMA